MNVYQKPILLSSIADVVFCKRRYYLRQVEQLQDMNMHMELGKQQHELVDVSSFFMDNGIYKMTNVSVFSHQYHLQGICDLVEFIPDNDGVDIDFLNDRVQICPVEYKHGNYKTSNEYIAQVVAQALCLEEMYGCVINHGCVHYVDDNRRFEFFITDTYRKLTLDAIAFVQQYDGQVIAPTYHRKCRGCALYDVCSPRKLQILEYVENLWR